MRVDAIADPTQIAGWDVIDARTRLRFPRPIAYADDELHVIGVASLCLSCAGADITRRITRIVEVSVPRVVIDPVRRAILVNAGEELLNVERRAESHA